MNHSPNSDSEQAELIDAIKAFGQDPVAADPPLNGESSISEPNEDENVDGLAGEPGERLNNTLLITLSILLVCGSAAYLIWQHVNSSPTQSVRRATEHGKLSEPLRKNPESILNQVKFAGGKYILTTDSGIEGGRIIYLHADGSIFREYRFKGLVSQIKDMSGNRLATATYSGEVSVINPAKETATKIFDFSQEPVVCLDVVEGKDLLVGASSGKIVLWGEGSQQLIGSWQLPVGAIASAPIYCAAYGNRELLVISTNARVYAATLMPPSTLKEIKVLSESGNVRYAALGARNQMLAYFESAVTFYSLPDFKVINSFSADSATLAFVFSPQADKVLTYTDQSLKVFDQVTGAIIFSYDIPGITSVIFLNDNLLLATNAKGDTKEIVIVPRQLAASAERQ